MALLSYSNFSKNILSVLLERVDNVLSIIIVYLYFKIEYSIILSINLIIFKVYLIFNYSQSCIFDNWWASQTYLKQYNYNIFWLIVFTIPKIGLY